LRGIENVAAVEGGGTADRAVPPYRGAGLVAPGQAKVALFAEHWRVELGQGYGCFGSFED
jgi:hypothetical protein